MPWLLYKRSGLVMAVLDFRLCRKRRSLEKKQQQQWVKTRRWKTFEEEDLDVNRVITRGVLLALEQGSVGERGRSSNAYLARWVRRRTYQSKARLALCGWRRLTHMRKA